MAQGEAALRLYAILDAESCARCGLDLLEVARAWRDAGVTLVQYRDKVASRDRMLANALNIRKIFQGADEAFLLLNDHPDLVADCGFDGAHVGQGDMSAAEARRALGEGALVGVSTHTADQAMAASETEADYVAVGPVYATRTKADAEPVVGLCGVQAAAAVVRKPLVAIGGIGPGQGSEVLRAGASTVALISALLPHEQGMQAVLRRARDILVGLK